MSQAKETGNKGEDLAINYLQKKGFKILKRNWHYGKMEIDIIALDDDILVFVEVKTRTVGYLVKPELSVSLKQQRFLIKAANAFINTSDYNLEARFDIVSIVIHPEGETIKHIDGAFLFL